MIRKFEPGGQSDSYVAICPYCGEQHGDCWDWVTEDGHCTECAACEREYWVEAYVDITYLTKPLDAKGNIIHDL